MFFCDEAGKVASNGIDHVLIVSDFYADVITRMLADLDLESWKIGNVVAGKQEFRWAESAM